MNQSLINQESITKCLEYVEAEKQESFKQLVKSLKVRANLIDCSTFFDEDKEVRNIYRVYITRDGKTISFKFGDSIDSTQKGEEVDLYDVLTIVASEYDLYGYNFAEFCDEFGFNNDSRKAEKTFKSWVAQNKKFKKIFTDTDIESLPN